MRKPLPTVLALLLVACADDALAPLVRTRDLQRAIGITPLTAGFIFTIAGPGVSGLPGDGGSATDAWLMLPNDVAVDVNGNLYIADESSSSVPPHPSNHRIRKVDMVTGIISTVAGIGAEGYNGENVPATAAMLAGPSGVAFDASGNLYIAESIGHRIRVVDALTTLTMTVAGDGTAGSLGDGGPAIASQLTSPRSVDFDASNNLYIADASHRVRKVIGGSPTGIITPAAGRGIPGGTGDDGPAIDALLNSPRDVVLDASGNLYIADLGNHRIRKVDAATGFITTIVGTGVAGFAGDGGPAIAAQLLNPRGLAFDATGNLYIAEQHRIRVVDAVTGVINTVVGTGVAGATGDNGPALAATLNTPAGLAFDAAGNLFIADRLNGRIRAIALEVIVDIKPGSSPTTITLGNKGKTPVAILATANFDPAKIDVTSVRFVHSGWGMAPVESRLSDVDSDGDIDLLLFFLTEFMGIECGNTSAVLKGKTFGGRMIMGSESIRTVGCK